MSCNVAAFLRPSSKIDKEVILFIANPIRRLAKEEKLGVKHGAGTILLTNQAEKEEAAKEDAFVLHNWSYSGLKEKIAYKAERAGIVVITE